MHGKLRRDKIRRRDSVRGWAITLVAALVTFVLLVAANNRGITKKWVTATMGTLGPFSLVIYACRRLLLRWSFWTALAICLAVHVVAIWAFFQYVLADSQTISIWLWFPVMLMEVFVLLFAVKRIEEKLTGKHETIKLSF
jgi:peptidoglycan/LPS O-acetylase OafA/YrhL